MATSSRKLRLAVLFGGRSGEHEVSLASAKSVLSVLDVERYEIFQVGIGHDGDWFTGKNARDLFEKGSTDGLARCTILPDPSRPGLYLLQEAGLELLSLIDVVFPVLHGSFGEDGTVQGLLELADLAYVGAGVTGSAVGMDKAIFKDVMHTHHIPTVESMVVLRSEIEKDMAGVIQKAEAVAPYPLFVKPANLGSSVGIDRKSVV